MEIKSIKMKTAVSQKEQKGNLEVFLEMKADGTEQGKVFLWAQLIDENGDEADRIFPMELESQTQFCMEVEKVHMWNMEDPYLYELVLELRDEESRLLGCTSKKTAFWIGEKVNDKMLLNGETVVFRRVENEKRVKEALRENDWEEKITELLAENKRRYKNCLCLPVSLHSPRLQELCLEYGICLLEEEEDVIQDIEHAPLISVSSEGKENPDFEIQVVEEGVLIENKSRFINVNIYALQCEILKEDTLLQQSVVEADIPAGSSRYLELPFIKPQNPGTYRYRVSLCLKKDMPWAKKGYAAASGETLISNMWLG